MKGYGLTAAAGVAADQQQTRRSHEQGRQGRQEEQGNQFFDDEHAEKRLAGRKLDCR